METVLKEAGTCGRFQVLHVIFTQIPRFVTVWGIMVMMFGSYDPGWRCQEFSRMYVWNGTDGGERKDGYESSDYNNRNSSAYTLLEKRPDFKTEFGESFTNSWKVGNQSAPINRTVGGRDPYNETCDVMKVCGDVEFDPGSITIVSEFELVCDRKWILKVMLMVMGLGFLTGALVGGQVCEKFGRKASLVSGCFIMFVFNGIAIFSTHWIMYTVCLFFIGVGANIVQSTSAIFSMEFLNSKWRSIFSSIPTWNVSLCVFTFTTALMKSWVHVHILACTLSLLASIGYFLLSESVRWLVVHGRYDEANKVMRRVARINRKPSPSHEILQRLKPESNNVSEKQPRSSQSNLSPSSQTTYTYLHLFRTRNLRVLTTKFLVLYLMMFVTYFSLSFGINSIPGDYYVNLVVSSTVEIVVVLVTGPLCNRIGRRWGGFAVSSLGAISCISIVISLFTSEGETQSTAVKTCAFLARGGSMGMSAVATVFMAELFPTAVRSVAFGMIRAMSGVGSLLGPFLIPEPTRESFAICFAVMSCCFGLSLFIFLSLSETNKLCLVDVIDNSSKKRATEEECV